MRAMSPTAGERSTENARREFRDAEENFGSILTEIAVKLFPKPNTAAKIAAELGCSPRNIEACLSERQKWSGDAVALFVAEICRRHAMRNVKIVAR